ncbi:MAG: hypothetical protein AB1Z20_00380 [Desulfobacterales bacterium]
MKTQKLLGNIFRAAVLLSFLNIVFFGSGCGSGGSGGGGGGGGDADILTGLGGTASGSLTLLYQLNETTGTPTRFSGLGLGGLQSVQGLAYDADTDTLYGIDTTSDYLITIDGATGEATLVGLTGFDDVQGLAYDANTDTLYGVNSTTAQLITIDPATGAGTAVGSTGAFMLSLAFIE